MSHKTRVIIRWVIFIVSLILIIKFQRKTGVAELLMMLASLGAMLAVLWDYNRDYTHPRKDRD